MTEHTRGTERAALLRSVERMGPVRGSGGPDRQSVLATKTRARVEIKRFNILAAVVSG